ncbi:MAG: hypothetical protein NVV66_08710 [Cellulomonas sp.]|uniref:hypothetical protein n=1 Tax=Cellulomonas sp. TaxID=40001 RepID=UPI00258B41C4|nr:hypothetical protein [Cellulomonas sp.]MCR6704760.1 hypothetical protein [Cellulomonas sp.]
MDTAVESALRLQIIAWLHERADRNGGFLHRHELLSYRTGDRDLPLIDFSRGIRNPAGFASTLAIVQSAHGRTTTSKTRTTACCTMRLLGAAVSGEGRGARARYGPLP